MAIDQQKAASNEKVIAIVEDDAKLAVMFCDMLGHVGNWQLHVFSDGQDAQTHLPELGAHLILLDVGLPNLDGASLYKILRMRFILICQCRQKRCSLKLYVRYP